MAIEFRITGVGKLKKAAVNFKKGSEDVQFLLYKAAQQFAIDVHKRITSDYMSGPRPEKIQPISNRLRSSIKFNTDRGDKYVSVSFGTDVPYARIHEYGGATGRNYKTIIKPRPYLMPGIQDAVPKFQEDIEAILLKVASSRIPDVE